MEVPSKTLVIRFSSVGDIVLATPLLRVLREKFPQSQIDFVTRTEYAELVKNNHNLNLVHQYDVREGLQGLRELKRKLKAERYDLVVDIHGSLRSRYLTAGIGAQEVLSIDKRKQERFVLVKFKQNLYKNVVPVSDRYIESLNVFGIRPDGKGPELHIPDEILFGVSGKIATLRLSRFEKTIGLCPGSRHFTKRWPWERFAELGVRLVRDHDAKILIFGSPQEQEYNLRIADTIVEGTNAERVTDFTGQLSLLETAAAMEFCDVIVSNDSGLMHIASAMHKKLVAIFGSTVREFGFFPRGIDVVVVEREGLYCRPCSHIGKPSCPEAHFRCMREIETSEIFSTVQTLLGRVALQQK